MRITFLTHFPGRGGSTSWLLQLRQLFQAHGHETSVLAGDDSPDPQLDSYQVFHPPPRATWRRRLQEYRALVESTRPDAVYFVSGVEEGDLLRFLPYVRVRHTFALEQHAIINAPYWIKQLFPYWEAITANTPDVFELLREFGPEPYEEIFTPYWLGPDFYNLQSIPPRPLDQRPIEICCIGRIENYQKRMHWIPQIAARCRDAGREFIWHIYGAGPAEDSLREELQRRSCADIVHLHGWVGEKDLARRAVQHDIYFCCSRFEGLPVSLQQAMFCGLHCVAPDLPAGIRYVIQQGAVAGYHATGPESGVQALLTSTADRALLQEKKFQSRELAFKLFGPAVAERQFLRLESAMRDLRCNGRVLDIEKAPKVRTIPVWKFLKRRLLDGKQLNPDEKS